MTNAEKYIGDEDLIDTFIDDFYMYLLKKPTKYAEPNKCRDLLVEFFKQPIKPTLTEDERVILRNIDHDLKYIHRSKSLLYFSCEKGHNLWLRSPFGYNKFQFIKERRRI